ncbi:MAG TPA: DUF3466 family protein, partial [Bacteroidota bacterium]|nr:DUF3466 family protein [Bacteroidota bacterium]
MQHQRLSLIKTLLLSCTIPWVSLAQVRYSVTEIPTLGGSESVASGINSSTQIVGNATITGDTARHAILWDNGTLTDLGTLGGNFSTANGINSIAQVVGFSRYSTGSDNGHAFLWQNGHMTDLGTLGGPYSAAADINNSGKMVGYSSTPGDSFRHAFLWQGVDGTDLGVLGTGTNAIAYAINNIDQIVGGSQTDGNLSTHVFLWQNGNMTDLNVPGSAYDINNSTQIVGQSLNHAFLWQNGVLTDLLTLGGSTSQAFDINNSGTVVGRAQTSGNVDHAFIWENGVMTDLNTLIDSSSGWILTVANCINDKGEIAGSGKHNGKSRGFLLRPAPRRPVLIIPGVGATYSADVSSDLTWLIHRGVPPSQLQIDPMTKVYHDLIQTLKNVGYVEGKDLFRVNYDWRLPPGPDDGSIDGRVGGFTASSISDSSYLYAVDYLGEILKQASVQWQTDHPGDTLDAV